MQNAKWLLDIQFQMIAPNHTQLDKAHDKIALVNGATGQDGLYITAHLLYS